MTHLILFIVLCVFSYLGVYWIRQYTEKRHILDHPSERSSRTVPTPRGGGLAIVACVLGLGIGFVILAELNKRLIYLVCGAVIAWLGWRDDLHSLSPRLRFAVQGIVAALSVWWLGYFKVVTIPIFSSAW